MPLFKCTSCGCVENTAISGYWSQQLVFNARLAKETRPPPKLSGKPWAPLCSECNPDIGKWHGQFPKEAPAVRGYKLGDDGFLYNAEWKPSCVKIVGDP